jgi:hypothetical protein
VDVFAALRKTSEVADRQSPIKSMKGRGTLGMLINDPRMYYDIDRIPFVARDV